MNPYLPVVISILVGVGLGAILSALAYFMGPKKYRKEKHDPYECGVPKVTGAQEKMSVKFYLTAILFILFDLQRGLSHQRYCGCGRGSKTPGEKTSPHRVGQIAHRRGVGRGVRACVDLVVVGIFTRAVVLRLSCGVSRH